MTAALMFLFNLSLIFPFDGNIQDYDEYRGYIYIPYIARPDYQVNKFEVHLSMVVIVSILLAIPMLMLSIYFFYYYKKARTPSRFILLLNEGIIRLFGNFLYLPLFTITIDFIKFNFLMPDMTETEEYDLSVDAFKSTSLTIFLMITTLIALTICVLE